MKKHYYTDGKITIKLSAEDVIPDGFYLGRTFKVNTWNKGLKASTDIRVRKNTENCHKTRKDRNNYHSWNKGLTKESNTSLQTVGQKVSKARKGKSSWNKGIPRTSEQKAKQSASMKVIARQKTPEQKSLANQKSYLTKKSHNSFHTSAEEDRLYLKLCEIYGEDNVKRQYKSCAYPFACDFYIDSENIYIEANLTWTHGWHPYDKNNPQDQNARNEWERKSTSSQFYKNALNVWTIKDPIKLDTFKNNKLNFMLIYPKCIVGNDIDNINKVTKLCEQVKTLIVIDK